jgi:uncharacterized protein YggL (DUF469 family)
MKRRLRKKKHLGEFAEWGRQLVVTRDRIEGFDEFLDAFILEAIEANGFSCGGGGCEDTLDVVIDLGRMADGAEAGLRRIMAWLDARYDVKDYRLGALFDLWHGDLEDIRVAIGQANGGES